MEQNNLSYTVRAAYREEWQEAMALAWKTFLRYEAPDYTQEGIRNFREFITDTTLYRMYVTGSYQMFVAISDNKIVGMLTMRGTSHISLLFVDGAYHNNGIARELIQKLCNFLMQEVGGIRRVTVNAAPYAVGFYHKLGFRDLGEETMKDGIIFTPMEKELL